MPSMSAWVCRTCDVEGRDLEAVPNCWNCGGVVKVIARPTVMVDPVRDRPQEAS